jgi:hypothetical protein
MRGWMMAGLAAAVLAGCGEKEISPEEREMDVEKAIAEVEAAQTPPPDVVTPERITPDERRRSNLSESGCAFAVNNPEVGAQAILQMNVGYMKIGGDMERLAPDAGATDGPSGTKARYAGGRHALLVQFDMDKAVKAGGEGLSVPTRIALQDGRGRTVYVAEGTSMCR